MTYAKDDEALSVDALDVLSKPPQLADEICSLLDECFRPAIKQFDCAAKIFEARRRRVRVIIDLARVLEINADQFERCDHRIAIGDVMLALPLADCLCLMDHLHSRSESLGRVRIG